MMTPDQSEELSNMIETSLVSCEKHHCAFGSDKECPYCEKEKASDNAIHPSYDSRDDVRGYYNRKATDNLTGVLHVPKFTIAPELVNPDYQTKYTQLLEKHSKLQDEMMELQRKVLK